MYREDLQWSVVDWNEGSGVAVSVCSMSCFPISVA